MWQRKTQHFHSFRGASSHPSSVSMLALATLSSAAHLLHRSHRFHSVIRKHFCGVVLAEAPQRCRNTAHNGGKTRYHKKSFTKRTVATYTLFWKPEQLQKKKSAAGTELRCLWGDKCLPFCSSNANTEKYLLSLLLQFSVFTVLLNICYVLK